MKAALQIAAALVVNGALFLIVAKTNAIAKAKPVRDAWTVREVFVAAPPPRPAPPVEEMTSVLPAESAAPATSAPLAPSEFPAAEAFLPRLESMPLDLGGTAFGSGPPVPLGIGNGGSLIGTPGGVAGGVAGGTGTGGALQLSQVDRGPQRTVSPLPPYPSWARIRKLEGVVTLQFTVDDEGRVRDIVIESVDGDERFGPVAQQAVSGWTYDPGVYGGKKVSVRMIQRVRFHMVN